MPDQRPDSEVEQEKKEGRQEKNMAGSKGPTPLGPLTEDRCFVALFSIVTYGKKVSAISFWLSNHVAFFPDN